MRKTISTVSPTGEANSEIFKMSNVVINKWGHIIVVTRDSPSNVDTFAGVCVGKLDNASHASIGSYTDRREKQHYRQYTGSVTLTCE